jgi:hypothetical protein
LQVNAQAANLAPAETSSRVQCFRAIRLRVRCRRADAVAALWENTLEAEGPESDFTAVIKPIEAAAGVIVKGDSGE